MKTTLEIRGRVAGKEHVCVSEFPCDPETVFNENTLEGIFQQNTGVLPESLEIGNIRVERQVNKNLKTGFDTKNIAASIKKGRALKEASEQNLIEQFVRTLPSPIELTKHATEAFLAGDIEGALNIGNLFETCARINNVPEEVAYAAKQGLLILAYEMAEEIRKQK